MKRKEERNRRVTMHYPMNRLSVLAILLFAAIFFAQSGYAADKASGIGRYQIVAGKAWDEGEKQDENFIIKIDTVTGKTWRFSTVPVSIEGSSGAIVSGWVACTDDLIDFALRWGDMLEKKRRAAKTPQTEK